MRAWHFSNYPSSSVRFSRPARSISRRGTGEKAPPSVGPARPPESQKRNHGLLLVPIVTTVTRISAPKSPCNGANAPPLLANEKGERWHGSDPGRRRPACANGQREGRADVKVRRAIRTKLTILSAHPGPAACHIQSSHLGT